MRTNIPVPVVIAILAVALIAVVFFYWRQSNPGAQADKTEVMLKAAFGGKRTPPGAPPGAAGPTGVPGQPAGSPGPQAVPKR